MRGTYFLGNGAFETREMPERQLFETEVLVKVGACGVCGTDVHIYHGDKGSAEVRRQSSWDMNCLGQSWRLAQG